MSEEENGFRRCFSNIRKDTSIRFLTVPKPPLKRHPHACTPKLHPHKGLLLRKFLRQRSKIMKKIVKSSYLPLCACFLGTISLLNIKTYVPFILKAPL